MLLRRLVFASLAMLVWVGCIDYSEDIHLHADGSATIRLELGISSSLQSVVQRNPAFRPLAILMDEERLAENLPQGISLRNHHRIRDGGRQIFINELHAADVRNISASESAVFTGQSFSVDQRDDGTIRYLRVVDFSALAASPEFAQMMGQNRMGIAAMLQRAPFRFAFHGPLGIESTNGVETDGSVKWEFALGELLRGPVEQEIVFSSPTVGDYLVGAGRILFQPRVFPFVALLLLAVFFLVTRRTRSVAKAAAD